MKPIAFELPLRLIPGTNQREHWSKRYRRAKDQRSVVWLRTTAALVGAAGSPAVHSLLPVQVTITRIAPRRLDTDNAWSSAKHVIDGIADAFNLPDNDPRLTWAVRQERGGVKQYAVRVEITGSDARAKPEETGAQAHVNRKTA